MTQDIVTASNELLKFLVSEADPSWREVMEKTLDDALMETNLTKMESTLATLDREEPVGAIAAGTGVIKDRAGFEGEEGQTAVQMLKDHGRVQQCGRGRGKCLLILSDQPLDADAATPMKKEKKEAKVETPKVAAADADFDELLVKAKAMHDQMINDIDTVRAERDELHERVTTLEDELRKRDEAIEELKEKAVATWK